MVKKLGAAFAVLSLLLLAGCNNARIPDGGKVMRDSEGNEYLIKFHTALYIAMHRENERVRNEL